MQTLTRQTAIQLRSTQTHRAAQKWALWSTAAWLALLAAVPWSAPPSWAQDLPSLEDWQEAGFTPKVDTSAERTAGGGTRSVVSAIEVAALTPGHNSYGVTVKPDPSLVVYLAAGLGQRNIVLELEAVSLNGSGSAQYDFVHEQELEVEGQAGLMLFQLPATTATGAPLLEPGQDYRWTVTTYSDTSANSVAGVVTGYISYVPSADVNWTNPEAIATLDELPAHERGQYLFQNYIWYDGLVALAEAYQADPSSLLSDWEQVLETSGLKESEATQVLTDMAANPSFIASERLF